jgi:hypothetical protein
MTRSLLVLACALVPALALAVDAPPSAPAPSAAASPAAAPAFGPAEVPPAGVAEALPVPPPPPPAVAPYPKLGFALGVGAPHAATLDVLYRPLPWLRLSAGPSWAYVGWGLHGGVVLSPIRWAISPTLGLEAGRFFRVDANKYFTSADPGMKPLLSQVQLEYLAATIGLEFGSQRGFSFSLRAGLAWLQVDARGTGTFASTGGTPGANDAVVTVTDPAIRGTTPTVQLAFQYFL